MRYVVRWRILCLRASANSISKHSIKDSNTGLLQPQKWASTPRSRPQHFLTGWHKALSVASWQLLLVSITSPRDVNSVLGTRYSVLGTRYSVLGTRYSVLGTRNYDRTLAVISS